MVDSSPEPTTVALGDRLVMDPEQFDELIRALNDHFDVRGPVVSSGAIVTGPLRRASDLPVGWHDEQAPGHYRASDRGDGEYFGFAVGPTSTKPEFFPPHQVLWRSEGRGELLRFVEPTLATRDLALFGVRPCDVAALGILERVLVNGEYPDPHFASRRRGLFVVVVECARPASTCFCSSMGTGPGLEDGFDLAVTELHSPHRFLVRIGSERGGREVQRSSWAHATDPDETARDEVLDTAASRIERRVDSEGVPALLARNIDHPLWSDIAERCLDCANCTMACPTCFCSDVHDVTDLAGDTERQRSWSSCFDVNHSFLHGGPVRSSPSSRYRQWMTHKFSTWWDQFDSSGCVGCGRCVTWCPVGIDVTAELAILRDSEQSDEDTAEVGRL